MLWRCYVMLWRCYDMLCRCYDMIWWCYDVPGHVPEHISRHVTILRCSPSRSNEVTKCPVNNVLSGLIPFVINSPSQINLQKSGDNSGTLKINKTRLKIAKANNFLKSVSILIKTRNKANNIKYCPINVKKSSLGVLNEINQ